MRRIAASDWGFGALAAVAAVLAFAFTVQPTLATFGDDSASYLTLAHWMAGAAGDPHVVRWAGFHSNFPPLWPLVLRLTGGYRNYAVGHAAAAACAIASLPVLYAWMARQGSRNAALATIALFLACAGAWISMKGLLSEPLFLLTTAAALLHFEARVANGRGHARDYALFGVLLGLASLTRFIGLALVAAYVAHVACAWLMRRDRPGLRHLLPLVVWCVLVAIWYAVRPSAGGDVYARTAGSIVAMWREGPAQMLHSAVKLFIAAWIATFTVDSSVPSALRAGAALLGLLALGGLVLRLARNRIDAWYVAVSLAIVFPWVFSEDNTRRLLYPLLPWLIFGAGDFLRWTAQRLQLPDRTRAAMLAFGAGVFLLVCAPALVLIAQRAQDRGPVIAGLPYAWRDVTDYYTTLDAEEARKRAMVVVATLGGLESIAKVTPPQATVMWMRPEYVALLGHRNAVPFLYRWDEHALRENIARLHADYVVVSVLLKTDLAGDQGNSYVDTQPFAKPVVRLLEGVFVLAQVDPQAVAPP